MQKISTFLRFRQKEVEKTGKRQEEAKGADSTSRKVGRGDLLRLREQ